MHMSGLGIIADNARGEKIDNIKTCTDVGFGYDDCLPGATHVDLDTQVRTLSPPRHLLDLYVARSG
jgi:hypothetical protein